MADKLLLTAGIKWKKRHVNASGALYCVLHTCSTSFSVCICPVHCCMFVHMHAVHSCVLQPWHHCSSAMWLFANVNGLNMYRVSAVTPPPVFQPEEHMRLVVSPPVMFHHLPVVLSFHISSIFRLNQPTNHLMHFIMQDSFHLQSIHQCVIT